MEQKSICDIFIQTAFYFSFFLTGTKNLKSDFCIGNSPQLLKVKTQGALTNLINDDFLKGN